MYTQTTAWIIATNVHDFYLNWYQWWHSFFLVSLISFPLFSKMPISNLLY